MQKWWQRLNPKQRRYVTVLGIAGLAALLYMLSRRNQAPVDTTAQTGNALDTSGTGSDLPSAASQYPPYNLGGDDSAAISALGTGITDALAGLEDTFSKMNKSQSKRIGVLGHQLKLIERRDAKQQKKIDNLLQKLLHQRHGGRGGGGGGGRGGGRHGGGRHGGGGGGGHGGGGKPGGGGHGGGSGGGTGPAPPHHGPKVPVKAPRKASQPPPRKAPPRARHR